MANRSFGVTIICILGFLGAILAILGGVALLGVGAVWGTAIAGTEMAAMTGFGEFFEIMGGVFLILGIVTLIALIWLWQMKKIGWTIVMILEVIFIILALIQFNIINLIIPVIIVAYLWMKKDLFK